MHQIQAAKRLLMHQWLLIASCCHSTSSNWLRSSWWRKRPWSRSANYTMCDSYQLQASLDPGSMRAKPQGLPFSLTTYKSKSWAGQFNCFLAPPEYSSRSFVNTAGWPVEQCKDDWAEAGDFTAKEYLFLVFHSSSKVQMVYSLHKSFFRTFNTSELTFTVKHVFHVEK